VPDGTVTVIVDVLEVGTRYVGLKLTVTPAGCPLATGVRAVSLGSGVMLSVIVEVPLLPGATESEAGEAERLKFSSISVKVVEEVTPPPVPVTVMV